MAVVRNNSKRMKTIKDNLKDKYKTCFFCGEFIDREYRTIDHFTSLSKGGKDSEENMVVSCTKCNCEKADLDVTEYIELKLKGFDFEARAEKNKRKKGFGYKGAIYEEDVVLMKDLIFKPMSEPNREKVDKRKQFYIENHEFKKPTYVKKTRRGRYLILQGFINYLIMKELDIDEMPVVIVRDSKKIKNKNKKTVD